MDLYYHHRNYRSSRPSRKYFSNFILILIALAVGFFAKDIMEHYTGKSKPNEYMQSLYNDLKTDTALIRQTDKEKAWIEAKYDSAATILATGNVREHNEFLYYVERYLSHNNMFTSQETTYLQLRSSGKGQNIKDLNEYKKIADYYTLYEQYKALETGSGSFNKNDLTEIESDLFSPRDLTSLDNVKSTTFYGLVIRPTTELMPIRREISSLKLFYIKVDNARKQTKSSRLLLSQLKENATGLMKDLEKEYNVK
jgi:hypothetical protein